jgi:hypothetical protein
MGNSGDAAPEHSGAETESARFDESDICRADSLVGSIVKSMRAISKAHVKPVAGDSPLTSSMHRLREIEQLRKAILARKQAASKQPA